MATKVSLAIRKDAALERAAVATATIVAITGAEIAPFPPEPKRLETQGAIEAEWIADALEAIAVRSGEQVALFRSEIANLTNAWQEAESKLEAAGKPTSKDAKPK